LYLFPIIINQSITRDTSFAFIVAFIPTPIISSTNSLQTDSMQARSSLGLIWYAKQTSGHPAIRVLLETLQ